jgi:hypothetical protein
MILSRPRFRRFAILLASLAMANAANAAPRFEPPLYEPVLRETTGDECLLLKAVVGAKFGAPAAENGPFLSPLIWSPAGIDSPLREARIEVSKMAPTLPDDAVDDFALAMTKGQQGPVQLNCDFGTSSRISKIPRTCTPAGGDGFECHETPTAGVRFGLPLISRRGEDGLVGALMVRPNAGTVGLICHMRKSGGAWAVVACSESAMGPGY